MIRPLLRRRSSSSATTRRQPVLGLVLAQDEAQAVRLDSTGNVVRSETQAWTPVATELAERREALRRLLERSLEGVPAKERRAITGVCLLDPATVLADAVAVPAGANRGATERIIAVATERLRPPKWYGALERSWRLAPPSTGTPEALVFSTPEQILAMVREAFGAAGVPLLAVTDGLAAQLSHPALEGLKDGHLFYADRHGVGLLELRDGQLARRRWITLPSEAIARRAALIQRDLADHPGGAAVLAYPRQDETALLNHLRERFATLPFDPRELDDGQLGALRATARRRASAVPWNFAAPPQGLPAGLRRRAEGLAEGHTWRRAVLALAAGLAFVILGEVATARSLVPEARRAAEEFQIDVPAYEDNIRYLDELKGDRRNPLDLLLALQKAKPEGVTLESFQMDRRGAVTLEGKTQKYSQVEAFTAALSALPQWREAATQSTRPLGDEGVAFTIRGRLWEGR